MRPKLTVQRKAPNKAFSILLASLKLLEELTIWEDWNPESFPKLLSMLQDLWETAAKDFPCKAEKLRFTTNERYRKNESEPWIIWLTWGTSNGGDTLAALAICQT